MELFDVIKKAYARKKEQAAKWQEKTLRKSVGFVLLSEKDNLTNKQKKLLYEITQGKRVVAELHQLDRPLLHLVNRYLGQAIASMTIIAQRDNGQEVWDLVASETLASIPFDEENYQRVAIITKKWLEE